VIIADGHASYVGGDLDTEIVDNVNCYEQAVEVLKNKEVDSCADRHEFWPRIKLFDLGKHIRENY